MAGPVLFIAIDTEGWSGAQLEWIAKILKASAHNSDIKWRIVYGHHPMFTSGVHLNERRIGVLRAQLFPVLKDANVDVYICGHDHDIEHLRKEADLRQRRRPTSTLQTQGTHLRLRGRAVWIPRPDH